MYLLITGATGHIGSCLSKACNDKKIKTVLLTRSEKKKKILKNKFKNCKVITNNQLKKCKYNISTIIHTASINDKKSNNDNNSIYKNLEITIKILKDLDVNKLKKVIYLSSAQVYGSNLIRGVNEETQLIPINNYGISRCFNELFLKKFSKQFKKNLIILRISNVVGDPAITNKECLRLLPNDIKSQANLYGKLTLRSSGLQYRNFISIGSVIRTILKLRLIKSKEILIFNLGGVNIKIKEFIKKFVKIYQTHKNKELKTYILSNKPKNSHKLNYSDTRLRSFLKIKKREDINSIIKNFL